MARTKLLCKMRLAILSGPCSLPYACTLESNFARPVECLIVDMSYINKTISDGGITVDFWIIKVHTSN